MTVRMRHTKSHTANRRSHHALKNTNFSTCSNCATPHITHKVCTKCGFYGGKKILDVVKAVEKKQAKAKAKAKKEAKA